MEDLVPTQGGYDIKTSHIDPKRKDGWSLRFFLAQ